MTSFMAEGGATFAEQFVGFEYEGRMDGQNHDNSAIYTAFGADSHRYYNFLGICWVTSASTSVRGPWPVHRRSAPSSGA